MGRKNPQNTPFLLYVRLESLLSFDKLRELRAMTVFRCSNNIGVGVATCKVCFGSINVFMPGTNITFERSIYNLPDVLVWMAYIYLCSLILFALAEGFPVDRGMYLVAFSFFLQIAIFYPCYVLLTSRSQKTNMADRAMVEPDQKVFIPLSAEDI